MYVINKYRLWCFRKVAVLLKVGSKTRLNLLSYSRNEEVFITINTYGI